MAVISFCSNGRKETGQTLSLVAVATKLAIEHNYKILVISTEFDDFTLENCFLEYNKMKINESIPKSESVNLRLDSGIDGLIKVLNSNKSSAEIVKNYSKTILRERLDILISFISKDYEEYKQVAEYYSTIISMANRYYDLVLVDVSKRLPIKEINSILQMSDLVIMNLVQNLKIINSFIELQAQNEFYKRKNVMLLVGKYDKCSKYNVKNITRYLKEKKEVLVIPYSTLFLEACSEGTVVDYILKTRNLSDETDENAIFIKEVKNVSSKIILKLQELQMRM